VSDAALERIRDARILPIVRTDDAGEAEAQVARIVEGGLEVVELTTTIPGWERITETLRDESPELCVGVGTITSAELAAAAVAAGAQFCVTPYPVPAARPVLADAGIPMIEAGFSPSEVLGAAERGVAKLFPAHLGGAQYLRSLLAVAPAARIVPSGGIALEETAQWLTAGAFAVGIGSDLTRGDDVRGRVQAALRA
jgi:2-dehydro-3-deoxyphosphogluconate aldolase / (4S)-4-hydroxy-2-oxoglutarate aldolase